MTSSNGEAVADPPPARRGRNGKTAPTIYDIARLADVNPSTVSRALSQPGRINVKTEERIRAAAKQLNYRVNPIARALPTGRTLTLGLLVADITNPMLFGIVRGAEHAAAQNGYTLIIAESQESGEREAAAAERVLPSVDGLVLATTRLGDTQIQSLASRKPLVVINRDVEGVDSVLPDVSTGVNPAVNHLYDLGHRSIAFLAGPATSWISRKRSEAIAEAAAGRGMDFVEIGPGTPTLDGGRAAFSQCLDVDATAIIAYNDLMAIGLLREAGERGVIVPDQLSIVGFDDIFGADFTNPPLTTIRTPLADAGARAVRILLERSTEADAGLLPTELIVRESTGRAPRS
ncbi:LacI family DNA-binding transcriptional regulator [Salinibacterium sp. ZJ450]|uniref:LacI family DNA-binding transcriptional regulator n=1 Tax=Salinibacterium sp. ZJ450 TaxID=2708338 RepID=UPI001423AD2C|nr:LacI family DNA-binding transcriptional regulator [Salinibacterium sp. ZJ450]